MRTLGLVVLALLQPQGQDPTNLPQQPIRNIKVVRTFPRHDPRTGKDVEEITLILHAEESVEIDIKKKITDLRGVKASYFTEPEKNRLSKEIQVTARKGRLDDEGRTLKLEDHVRVVKKNDDEKPPQADTVLLASSLILRFNKMYECPECRKLEIRKPHKRPGRCLDHDVLLKEATITSIEADRDFEMTGPEGILSGEGLFTDDAINKEYHITKNGFIELEGDTSALAGDKKAPAMPETKFTQIFSRGPLHVTGEEHHRLIDGRGGVRIDRIDASGTLSVHAQEMTVETQQERDPESGGLLPPEIRNVDGRGQVILEGVTFADGTAFHGTSDKLTRRAVTGGDVTVLTSTGETPVHLKTGSSTIESRIMTITRAENEDVTRFVFDNVERSDLVSGDQHFTLQCARLTTHLEPDATGRAALRTIRAERQVFLGGLLAPDVEPGAAKGDPGRAEADYFEWDSIVQRGWLEALPQDGGKAFVTIIQGASTILAPKVVLESPKIIVLKGPKQVHLVQERGKVKEQYRATCEGDMILDQAAQRLWMRDRCVIQTQELLLRSDRVNAKLSEAGGSQGLESLLALGRVSAHRTQDHTTLYGDRLAFRFADQDLKVYGAPYTVADTGRAVTRQEQIRIYEKMDPKTKQLIRYKELIGGPDGVHMEFEERPGEKK